ncbi:hypothetical protein SAMD00019534_117330 [Acytostelium subglobosum LB1]|uniref:hypothetical protein n=1 Tax=Acytostelium subglobosum LB1 TaxID=1410327 RepID=UPI000644B006|nr:hypothetical protein SAMD00019534_117330 [Acytostelium subglobosum LB1]GAM28557.1 hypothetical protein SAMD00019534_117330 [Acytostelium subglobosum LB1]|eukprot:XP_012748596.1 hypothetical protein SAMD00019534_117330 [Acytostelium subglobosum LB1]
MLYKSLAKLNVGSQVTKNNQTIQMNGATGVGQSANETALLDICIPYLNVLNLIVITNLSIHI